MQKDMKFITKALKNVEIFDSKRELVSMVNARRDRIDG